VGENQILKDSKAHLEWLYEESPALRRRANYYEQNYQVCL